MQLPTDIREIIMDYFYSMNHYEKMKLVMYQLKIQRYYQRFALIRREYTIFQDWYNEVL